jgi:hypothetical protein
MSRAKLRENMKTTCLRNDVKITLAADVDVSVEMTGNSAQREKKRETFRIKRRL